ncbi:MAG: leucine-rich repeat protein [Clostridia bacterium]|nr:leucine-rich repeat protein [Clostridia bacterium]
MDDQELLQRMVAEPWQQYRRAGWREKLDLLRHSFSMYIPHADKTCEDLHIVLDGHTKLNYMVNKAAAVSDDHTVRGFIRFVFALKEGETKLFTWVTAHGNKEWILSRDSAVLYVDIPDFGEGFFIRYGVFRDECFAAYEKVYAWGYQSDVQRIEVPERDLESLTWLEPEEEFELVRYLDDGRSFETTDTDRLLRFVDEHRVQEEASEDPDPDRVQRFNDLYQSIKYYVLEQKPLRRAKKVSPVIGKSFSWMEDNWEECDFRYNVSTDPDDWHDAVYRRYGDLPDGRHFGVYIWPKSGAFSPASVMMIVDKSGEMRTNTVIKESWNTRASEFWPMAAAATPSGKSIVWLKDGRIWVWREDRRDKRFLPDDGEELTDRIEGIPVYDALMRDDGILVLFQEGKGYAYLCDEDIVLVRHEDCWIPASKAESPCRNEVFPSRVDDWPDEFAVMIRKEDDEGDYYSCGIRRVCFEPGLEIIKPEILADNPDLESVTIPASVKEVRTWAFGCCTNLKHLVIEGDLSRVANWAPDAFEGCACEKQYLRLRNADR